MMSQGDKSALWSGQSWTGERPSPLFFPPLSGLKVTLGEGKGIRGVVGASRLLKRNPPALRLARLERVRALHYLFLKKKKKKKVWAFRSTTQNMGHPDCKRSKEKQKKENKKTQNLRSLPNSNKYNHVLLSQHCATTRGHRFSTRQPSSYSQSNRTRVGQESGELVAYNLRGPPPSPPPRTRATGPGRTRAAGKLAPH